MPEPSVRLFYEYLQCDGYDADLYHRLVALEKYAHAT